MLAGMNTAAADGGARLLTEGNQVPVLGLGVWQVPDGRECVNAGVRSWPRAAGFSACEEPATNRHCPSPEAAHCGLVSGGCLRGGQVPFLLDLAEVPDG